LVGMCPKAHIANYRLYARTCTIDTLDDLHALRSPCYGKQINPYYIYTLPISSTCHASGTVAFTFPLLHFFAGIFTIPDRLSFLRTSAKLARCAGSMFKYASLRLRMRESMAKYDIVELPVATANMHQVGSTINPRMTRSEFRKMPYIRGLLFGQTLLRPFRQFRPNSREPYCNTASMNRLLSTGRQ